MLHDLAVIYMQQGDRNKAENMRTELTTLLPDSTLGKFLTDSAPLSSEDWTQLKRAPYLGFRIATFIIGIVLIILGLYLAWIKEKK